MAKAALNMGSGVVVLNCQYAIPRYKSVVVNTPYLPRIFRVHTSIKLVAEILKTGSPFYESRCRSFIRHDGYPSLDAALSSTSDEESLQTHIDQRTT